MNLKLIALSIVITISASALPFGLLINSVSASSAMWNQTYGITEEEYARSLVTTPDGGYALAGGTLLVKTDVNGNLEWSKTFSEGSANCLVLTADGGYALAGQTVVFDSGNHDFWLVKTDANGNIEWSQTYGAESTDIANCLIETSEGGFALAGQSYSFGAGGYDFWLVKTDEDGNMEWNQTYGGTEADKAYSLVATPDGGYTVTGETSSFGAGGSDFWLIKTDENGNIGWNQTYGGTSTEIADSLVVTSDGGYALAGFTTTNIERTGDFWLVKTDTNGNMKWNQTYGNLADWERAYALTTTTDGGYALAGQVSYSGIPISNDFWLVKTDAKGNIQWNQTYGIDEWGQRDWEIAYSLIETTDGGFALAGDKNNLFWLVKTDEHGTIPEFASWLILPIFAGTVLFVLIIKQKAGYPCK